jgi:superfamily II DNA or RNA helicase
LGSIVGTKRIEATKALIDGIDFDGIINSTEKKTVVFTSYVQALEKCKLVLDKKGFNPLAVYGQTNNNLQNIIKEFEINEEVNPLIATFASLSTAVPLVMADTMIMLNSPFRDYVYTQAISRIHRLGATSQVRVFVAELDTGQEPNISSRSTDILKWSQEQISKILGIPPAFEINESLESEKITISTEGLEEPIELHLSHNKDFTSW